jgi:hypothetical protein
MERVIASASRKDVLKNCDGVVQNARWKLSHWGVNELFYLRTVPLVMFN